MLIHPHINKHKTMGREAELPFGLAQENFDPSQNLSILVENIVRKRNQD